MLRRCLALRSVAWSPHIRAVDIRSRALTRTPEAENCCLGRKLLPSFRGSQRQSAGLPQRLICMAGNNTGAVLPRADAVLSFWLGSGYRTAPKNAGPEDKVSIWFQGGPEVDKACKEKFSGDLKEAEAGRLDDWKEGYNGLAAVILMDQLSRNIHRGLPQTYALDTKALALAKAIHDSSSTSEFPIVQRVWLYMALMHSEELEDLELCQQRFEQLTAEANQLEGSEALQKMLATNLDYTIKHKDVIAQWGRYPHRNAILGRPSTPEEDEGLASGSIPRF